MIGSSRLQSIALAFAFLITCSHAQARFERVTRTATTGIVIYGTQPAGSALDCADSACKSGPVSIAIASALKKPGITVAGFFDAVRSDVMTTTTGSQIPYIEAFDAIDAPFHGTSGKSLALIVGNGAYVHFPRLQGSLHDAEIVGKGLSDNGFDTTILTDLNYAAFNKAIEDFLSRAGPDDTVVFYYSGHGFSLLPGTAFIPGVDATESDIDASNNALIGMSINARSLIDEFSRSRAGRKILIFDTHFPSVSPNPPR